MKTYEINLAIICAVISGIIPIIWDVIKIFWQRRNENDAKTKGIVYPTNYGTNRSSLWKRIFDIRKIFTFILIGGIIGIVYPVLSDQIITGPTNTPTISPSSTYTKTTTPSFTRTYTPTNTLTPTITPTPKAIYAWQYVDYYYQCINNNSSEINLMYCFDMLSQEFKDNYGGEKGFLEYEQIFHYKYKLYDCGSNKQGIYWIGIKYQKYLKTDLLFSGVPTINTSYFSYNVEYYGSDWMMLGRDIAKPDIESRCDLHNDIDRWSTPTPTITKKVK